MYDSSVVKQGTHDQWVSGSSPGRRIPSFELKETLVQHTAMHSQTWTMQLLLFLNIYYKPQTRCSLSHINTNTNCKNKVFTCTPNTHPMTPDQSPKTIPVQALSRILLQHELTRWHWSPGVSVCMGGGGLVLYTWVSDKENGLAMSPTYRMG